MQYETSITHKNNLESGLTVKWCRNCEATHKDDEWSVVCYSDESRWLIDNGSAEKLTLIGEISDGVGKCEILETSNGSIIALVNDDPQSWGSRDEWLESLSAFDRPEALALLNRK